MLFAECVSGWRGGGSFAFMDSAQRSGAFIFSVTRRLLSSQHWETFIKIIHFSHQILWSRDDSWALFAGHGVQHHLKVTAFSIFGPIRLRELRTKSKEETFFNLRLAASFVLVSFPHECLFSRPFRGQVPNGSRGQWSWKRLQQCLFLLFLWSDTSYWPPLSSFLIRKSPNEWKMASKRTSRSISPSHQSQEPRLLQVTWYLPGDDTWSWVHFCWMFWVKHENYTSWNCEGVRASGTQTSGQICLYWSCKAWFYKMKEKSRGQVFPKPWRRWALRSRSGWNHPPNTNPWPEEFKHCWRKGQLNKHMMKTRHFWQGHCVGPAQSRRVEL